jgi:hypothetical protein
MAAALDGLGSPLVGLAQLFQGPSFLVTDVLFPIFATVASLVVLGMGLVLWRKDAAKMG